MAHTTEGWQYDPRALVPQWDPTAHRTAYRHPTPPWTHDHGPTETVMGYTLASAQEMCRLENSRLAQRHPAASASRRPKAEADTEHDGYKALVVAILARAIDDAAGRCASPGHTSVEKIQADAQRWLEDVEAVTELLESAGYTSAHVLPQLQKTLER